MQAFLVTVLGFYYQLSGLYYQLSGLYYHLSGLYYQLSVSNFSISSSTYLLTQGFLMNIFTLFYSLAFWKQIIFGFLEANLPMQANLSFTFGFLQAICNFIGLSYPPFLCYTYQG